MFDPADLVVDVCIWAPLYQYPLLAQHRSNVSSESRRDPLPDCGQVQTSKRYVYVLHDLLECRALCLSPYPVCAILFECCATGIAGGVHSGMSANSPSLLMLVPLTTWTRRPCVGTICILAPTVHSNSDSDARSSRPSRSPHSSHPADPYPARPLRDHGRCIRLPGSHGRTLSSYTGRGGHSRPPSGVCTADAMPHQQPRRSHRHGGRVLRPAGLRPWVAPHIRGDVRLPRRGGAVCECSGRVERRADCCLEEGA